MGDAVRKVIPVNLDLSVHLEEREDQELLACLVLLELKLKERAFLGLPGLPAETVNPADLGFRDRKEREEREVHLSPELLAPLSKSCIYTYKSEIMI